MIIDTESPAPDRQEDTPPDASGLERLLVAVRDFPQARLLVIGDIVADQFLYGEISRVSREAPVLILQHEHTETLAGGAGNCALNIATLGGKVMLAGVVGADAAGTSLIESLSTAGVDCSFIVKDPGVRTTTKVRILAGQPHSIRQQVIRVDYEDRAKFASPEIQQHLLRSLRLCLGSVDAVIVSDYNYGVAGEAIVSSLRHDNESRNVPVFIDSRFRLAEFFGFTSATPNQDEVEHLTSSRLLSARDLENAGEQLLSSLGYRALLITRGNQGMLLLEVDRKPLYIPAVGPPDAIDVTGAGDTVMAAYALAASTGASMSEAAQIANYAGGIVVMKRGTASITSRELISSINRAARDSGASEPLQG